MADNLPSHLCPIYKKSLLEFRELVAVHESESPYAFEARRKIYENFYGKYLMLSEDWVKLLRHRWNRCIDAIALSHIYYKSWRIEDSDTFAEKHIYWKHYPILTFNGSSLNYSEYEEKRREVKHLLTIPHAHLTELFKNYKENGDKPITFIEKQQYESALKLYDKFQEAGDDDDKWLECIKELEDKEAKIANIEFRLGAGERYANVKLWKYYIEYMKTLDIADHLKIYQRYCRLFISDLGARAEYLKEIERVGKMDKSVFHKEKSWETETVTNYWLDVIDLERRFGTLDSALLMLEKALENLYKVPIKVQRCSKTEFFHLIDWYKENVMKEKEDLFRRWDDDQKLRYEYPQSKITSPAIYYKNCVIELPQKMSFHQSFIYYITKNANGNVLHKLHKTCKYFFKLLSTPVCHRLIIFARKEKVAGPVCYYDQSLFIHCSKMDFKGLKNLYVSHTLSVNSGQEKLMLKLSKIFYKVEVSNLCIYNEKNCIFEELMPFIKNEKLRKMDFWF